MIGQTISHYKILKKLGEGGMGVVYKAKDTRLDRFVALKFLPPHVSADTEEKKRFIHEAKAASALQHNNICTIHEIDETEDGQMFICMDHYEGETLKSKIHKGPLKLEEAVDFAIQIAQGLARAHEEHIVHRDVKPANIMVTKRGVVKILDFGLAKLGGLSRLTKTGTTLGTASYMSPEQTSGKEADHRSDVWSLGVVLYEMTTGQKPFKGDYDQAVVYSILNEQPEPVTGLRIGVPLELERILSKALAKDPNERYQDIADLRVDLKRMMKKEETATHPVVSGDTGPVMVPKSWFTKQRVGFLAVGVVVLLTAAGLWLFRSPSNVIDSLAILPLVNQSDSEEVAWLSTGIPETVIASLQQIPRLRVTSFLTLLERYKDAQPSVEDVKRHYNVRAVAKGKVAVVSKNIAVHMEIVDTRDNTIIFAKQYRMEGMDGLLDLQQNIAKDITTQLQDRLSGAGVEPVMAHHTPDPAAHHHYLRGRHFWYNRTPQDLDRAMEYFKKAIEIDPEYALAWSGLADTYHLMYKEAGASKYRVIPLAREAAEKALKLDDNLAETQTSLGGVLYQERKYKEAEAHFRKAIEINPNYLLAYHWSGNNFASATNYQNAIDRYEQALKLDPMSPIIAGNLANEYRLLQNYDRAREILDRAIALNPEHDMPYMIYGRLYHVLDDNTKAVEMAEKALSLRPTSLWTIDQAAQIHFWVRNYGRVIEILEKAIAEEPAFSRVVHMSLGVTYSGLEQYDKAIEHHLRAIEIDPLDIDSYKSLGETYYHFKDWQKAADTFKKVIELQPEDAWAYQWLGMVVGILGQTEQEKAYYQRATEIMPIQRLELGCWYLNYGDYPTAVTELIRAEKDRPNYPNNSFYLFTAQFLTGDYTGAEQSLSEWLNRLHYEDREALRGQAFPDGVVDRSSLVRYIRLILERFKAEKRPMLGRYEARLPATFYCLIGDYESAIQTLEYAYENFPVRAYYLPWYIRWIYFRPLHSDPRFWEIVRKMKLMPYFNKDNLPYINQ